MKKYKPIKSRIIGFVIEKIAKRSSGLYMPNFRRGMFSSVQPFVILDVGPSSTLEYKKGDIILIQDQFELISHDLGLWEYYKDQPEFSKLRECEDEFEAQIKTSIILESSVIGYYDAELINLFSHQECLAHAVG